MILLVLIGLFVLTIILMIPVAAYKMHKAAPVTCPQCEMQMKLISNTGKCQNCKAKLYKHASGEYRLQAKHS